jgi:hypothetical protein
VTTPRDTSVVGLALTQVELQLVVRGLKAVVEREGWSQAASEVAQMVSHPLGERDLAALREAEIEGA